MEELIVNRKVQYEKAKMVQQNAQKESRNCLRPVLHTQQKKSFFPEKVLNIIQFPQIDFRNVRNAWYHN